MKAIKMSDWEGTIRYNGELLQVHASYRLDWDEHKINRVAYVESLHAFDENGACVDVDNDFTTKVENKIDQEIFGEE